MIPTLVAPVLALVLALAPAQEPHRAPARCLWTERGWRVEELGLERAGDPASVAAAREAFEAHRRLHGWRGFGRGTAWVVSQPASCPPAALGRLVPDGEAARGPAELERELALVFAMNGLARHADRLLAALAEGDGTRAPSPEARAELALERARLAASGGAWPRVLDALEDLRPAAPSVEALEALDGEAALLRARALFALARPAEAERMLLERVAAGGARTPSCAWTEAALDAGRSPEDLFAPLAGVVGLATGEASSALARLARAVGDARLHRRLLARDAQHALPGALDALERGDHGEDVLELLALGGEPALAAALALAAEAADSDPRLPRLLDLLAETGDPRAAALVERALPDEPAADARSAGGAAPRRRAAWSAAAELLRDLASDAR